MVASLAEAQSHNVGPEVLLKHYRVIRDAAAAHKDTGMALARAKKSAKSDGIDLDAFRLLEGFAKLGTDEAEIRHRNLLRYAKWLDMPIGMQADMFGDKSYATVPDKAKEEQAEWAAGDAGRTAGRAGHERDTNPHAPGSAEHASWDRSWKAGNKTWLAGQATIANEMGANAGTNGRGRRAKAEPEGQHAGA